jgi:hypothetical protein
MSVEVYEAILYQELGWEVELEVFIAQAGVVPQRIGWTPETQRTARRNAPDYSAIIDHDPSFTTLTGMQFRAINSWFQPRGLGFFSMDLAIPAGLLNQFIDLRNRSEGREAAARSLIAELGLEKENFLRSLLPPGVKPTSLNGWEARRLQPAEDSPDLHGDTWVFRRRVEWPSTVTRRS